MYHPFENDAPHIKLWGASFPNCPAYFGQPENGNSRVLSGYTSSCVSFIRGFDNVTLLFFGTPILDVWSKNSRVMLPKSQTEDTWEQVQPDNTRQSWFIGGFRTYHPKRVYPYNLSFLTTLCFRLFSIENGWRTMDNAWWIQWH
jgi:hypothetical protein